MTPQHQTPEEVAAWISRQKNTEQQIDISLVIPAYNEMRRLPSTLVDSIDYLDSRGLNYEIIVVDDGSSDQTAELVLKFRKVRGQVHLIRLPKNYGKGHAVRTGVLNAHGKRILFADADGASPISELPRLEAALDAGAQIAFGSRALRAEDTKVKTIFYRKWIGRIFNFLVNTLLLPGLKDTQCGFKMFSAPAGKFVFSKNQADGFGFDVELLYIARRAGIPMTEVPINWTNVPGSKVNLIVDSIKMFRDIFVSRLRHGKVSPQDYSSFLRNS